MLRGLRDDDVQDVLAYATSPGFFDHIDVPDRLRQHYGRHDAEAFLRDAAQGWATGYPTWAIECDGRLAGTIRVRSAAWHAGDEIGFGLAPAARGRGVATHAVDLVLGWCRREGRLAPWARCRMENVASVRVLERAGFQQERREGGWICWRPPEA